MSDSDLASKSLNLCILRPFSMLNNPLVLQKARVESRPTPFLVPVVFKHALKNYRRQSLWTRELVIRHAQAKKGPRGQVVLAFLLSCSFQSRTFL
jgi:hypothetical protein